MGPRTKKPKTDKNAPQKYVLNLAVDGPLVQQPPSVTSVHVAKADPYRRGRKRFSFKVHSDIKKNVSYLGAQSADKLDQLRDDLQEAIERVVRIKLAFEKELNKHTKTSGRVCAIIHEHLTLVSVSCDAAREAIDQGVKKTLESKAFFEELKRREAEEEEYQRQRYLVKRNFEWLGEPDF